MGLLDTIFSEIKDAALSPQKEDQDKKKDIVLEQLKKRYKLLLNPGVLTGIVIIGFVLFVVLGPSGSFFGGGGSGDTQPTGTPGSKPTVPPIPGFNIDIEGPIEEANGVDLEYTVTITHDPSIAPPLEEIEVFDTPPDGSVLVDTSGVVKNESSTPHIWPLSDIANQKGFTIKVRPNINDIRNYEYTVSARQLLATPAGGSSGNACTEPYEGTGYCSVENLASTFAGDRHKALIASMICQAESRSDPLALNTGCDPGVAEDYSVGLFQINLTVHCPGAYANSDCTQLIDKGKRDACEVPLKDPILNIQKMYALSAGTYWTPWSTWPGVKSKLASCDILI